MSNEDLVSGKVAQVVSDREVILNKGEDDGVTEGMYFHLLEEEPVDILDPDNPKVVLGRVRKVKLAVEAVEVAEKLTLARTFLTRSVNVGGTGMDATMFFSSMRPPKYIEEVQSFKNDDDSSLSKASRKPVVSIGDEFIQILGGEEEAAKSIGFVS